MKRTVTAASYAVIALCALARAQDMEPRTYSNSPTGLSFAIGAPGAFEA